MGLISRLFNFTAGTPAVADQVDAEFDQILALVNGNIEAANLASGSVTKVKLATDALNAFLKLAVAGDKKAALLFDGAAPASGSWGGAAEITGSIAHGLGGTPSHVFLTAGASYPGQDVIAASLISVDATNVNYKLRAVNGAALNFPGVKLYVLAIL